MRDLRKTLEEHYLGFIISATGTMAVIALLVWGVTYLVRQTRRG